ncbi:nucleotidyltransferase family protein [uncultured Dokdonia sp.]|nr:nucleotidyltransferase family protein [uncultured Dokdonia sp.]
MKDKRIKSISIDSSVTLINAMKHMDDVDRKSLLVFQDDFFLNILSIGDIQRAILNKKDLNIPVSQVLRTNTKVVSLNTPLEEVKKLMKSFRMEILPAVGVNNHLDDVYFWEDLFINNNLTEDINLNLPVVIMAGGYGTRMRPLTHVIPKPLIPLGESSMIEHIIDRFQNVGCNNFFVSVNYKADMIQFYFNDIKDKSYEIELFRETKPLGTAGSLHLLKGKINSPFFVSNCDILINDDYDAIYKYHKENNNELTMVSAIKNYPIAYGTLETSSDGVLEALQEKPELNFQINTGFYIVEPHLINEIPENKFFHITHLIEKLLEEKRKVGVFPISEGSWMDVGQWDEYNKTSTKLGFEGFSF